MLAFTPDVESALRWFDATYERETLEPGARWRRMDLPAPGGMGEQDAGLMDALDLLRRVHNDLVRPKTKPTT